MGGTANDRPDSYHIRCKRKLSAVFRLPIVAPDHAATQPAVAANGCADTPRRAAHLVRLCGDTGRHKTNGRSSNRLCPGSKSILYLLQTISRITWLHRAELLPNRSCQYIGRLVSSLYTPEDFLDSRVGTLPAINNARTVALTVQP